MDGSFEAALARGLRSELDSLNVEVPAAGPLPRRTSRARYVWTVARPLAVAVAAVLLLGSVAAVASGDPGRWVRDVGHQIGLPPSEDESPIGAQASPSPRHSESPEPKETAEPSESPEPAEHHSPEPPSPEDHQAPEPGDHASGEPSGDG